MKVYKLLFGLLLFALPFSASADEPLVPDYSKISVRYGLGILIILFFIIGSFVLSQYLKKKLATYNKRNKDIEALKKEKEKSLEEKWEEYMKNKENSKEIEKKY